MRVYRIQILGKGIAKDWDEWYPTLKAAKQRREVLITQNRVRSAYFSDFSIHAVDLFRLSPRTQALTLLNRHHEDLVNPKYWIKTSKEVLPPYRPLVDSNDSTR